MALGGSDLSGLPLSVDSSGNLVYTYNGVDQIVSGGTEISTFKSYSLSPGGLGEYWSAGFYDLQAADANLSQASTTDTYGTANNVHGAHALLVAAAAGSAAGGSGAVTITVTGTSVTDAGVRTGSDSETIVSDITAMSTDDYFETAKKWIGQITYTLDVGATGHTTYSADFNIGLVKYDDLGNRDFVITDFEAVGLGGATDTGFNIILFEHSAANWTYSATAFSYPSGNAVANMNTDYVTETDLASNTLFAYKRSGLSSAITGSLSVPTTSVSNGYVILVDVGANNAVQTIEMHVGSTPA